MLNAVRVACARAIASPTVVLFVAALALGSMLFPWHLAESRTYPGLDPNAIFVRGGSQPGDSVQLANGDRARIATARGSSQRIDLVDSESDFSATLDLTAGGAETESKTASVSVRPPPSARYFSVYIAVVNGSVLFHRIAIQASDSLGNPAANDPPLMTQDFSDPTLASWVGSPAIQRPAMTSGLTGVELSAQTTQVTLHTGIKAIDKLAPSYVVSANFTALSGTPAFNVSVAWVDAHLKTIRWDPDWPQWAAYATAPYVPAALGLWYPAEGYSVSLQFVHAGSPTVEVVTSKAGMVLGTTNLGPYLPGATYRVTASWIANQQARFTITWPDGSHYVYSLDRSSGFGLFRDAFVNLSIFTSGSPSAATQLNLNNVQLVIPPKTRFATSVVDLRVQVVALIVVSWLFAYLLVSLRRFEFHLPLVSSLRPRLTRMSLVVAIGGLASIGICVAAAQFDGHPFDHLSQGEAAYVVARYGLGALYGRTTAIPDTIIRGGAVPWNPAEFIYPPGMANFFAAVATIWTTIRGPIDPMGDRAFYAFWKLCYSVFMFIDVALIVGIARRMNSGTSWWPWILAACFAFNPAVLIDAPIWGQSNAMLCTPLLLAVLGLVVHRPRLAWVALAIAVSVKQTALLAVPIFAVFALRTYGLRRTIVDGAFGLIAMFVFISPTIFEGYSPSTILSTTVSKLIDFGTPLTNYTTQVSADTFPIWVLITPNMGLHGHERLWTSDQTNLPFVHVSYANGGLVLFGAVAVLSLWTAWRAADANNLSWRRLMLATALMIVGYVTTNTRTSGHYLTLAVPFLLLAIPSSATAWRFWKVGLVSLTAVVSMYGLFMFISAKGEWPVFAGLGSPSTNPLSAAVYHVYISDIGITIFAAILLYTTLALGAEAVTSRGSLRPRRNTSELATPQSIPAG